MLNGLICLWVWCVQVMKRVSKRRCYVGGHLTVKDSIGLMIKEGSTDEGHFVISI